MNASISSSDPGHLAYRLLKRHYCYYNKMDLFLRARMSPLTRNDLFQERHSALATIVDELRKEAPSPKSRRAIKAWQELDYAAIIAVDRKIPEKDSPRGLKNPHVERPNTYDDERGGMMAKNQIFKLAFSMRLDLLI